MPMKRLFLVSLATSLLTGLFSQPADGANIIWVTANSDSVTPPSPDDSGWTDLLTSNGHSVTRITIDNLDTDDAVLTALNSADLVIISPDYDSGNLDDNALEIERWNSVSTPLINMNASIIRDSGWRWVSSDSNLVSGVLQVSEPSHAIFEDVALDGLNQVTIHESTVAIVSTNDAGNGRKLGFDSANSGQWITHWEAGTEFFSGSGQTAGGPRLFFAGGSVSAPNGSENFNAEGEQLFMTAVDYMLVRRVMKITFSGYTQSETLVNVPLLLELSTSISNFSYNGFTSTNGYDLRVWSCDQTQLLDYEIDTWDTNGTSFVWVKVPELAGTNTCIHLSWGNNLHTNIPASATNGSVWSEGFTGVWHLDDTSDSSGNGFDGTGVGITKVGGQVGNAQAFEAAMSDRISLGDMSEAEDRVYTYSAWLKTTQTDNNIWFLTEGNTSSDLPFVGNFMNNGVVSHFARDQSATVNLANGTTPINDDAWHLVATTSDGSTMRIFIDGVEDASTSLSPISPVLNVGGMAFLNRLSPCCYYNGLMEEVRISSVPRSADWIQAVWLNMASNSVFNNYSPVELIPIIPTIINEPATNINTSSAWLNAVIDNIDTQYTVIAYWGPTDGGTDIGAWSNSSVVGMFDENSSTAITFFASGISPNTTTFFTFQATNITGSILWAIPSLSFTTDPLVAPVINNTIGAVAIGSALLQGELTDGGDPANVTLYWGDNDGGTNAGAWDTGTDIGAQFDGPFSGTVTGLLYGVPYYYRASASNSVGTAWAGTTATFKTLSPSQTSDPSWRVTTYDTIWGTNLLNPVSNLIGTNATATHTFTNSVFDYNNFAEWQVDYPSLTDPDFYSVLWENTIQIDGASTGVYTFGTSSDDGSVWYVDLTGDGDFDDPNELIVDNNGLHADRRAIGEVNLAVPGCYATAIAFFEAGGSEVMEARYRFGTNLTYAALDFVDGSSGSTDPFFSGCSTALLHMINADATSITTNSAMMNGSFNAPGSVFDLELYYGLTNGGTNSGAWDASVSFGSITNAPSFDFGLMVTGLQENTTYQFAWRATNCAETMWAQPSAAFRTLWDAINNVPGADVGTGSAVLQGTLKASAGGPTDVTIYWGDNDGGTDGGSWDESVTLNGVSIGPVTSTVTGLLFGTEYFYRLYMTNSSGEAWANSSTNFTTKNPLNFENRAAWLWSTNKSNGSNILNTGSRTTLDWNVHKLDDMLFAHNPTNAHELILSNAGDYLVAFTLPITNINTSVNNWRTCIRAELYMNGIAQDSFGAIGESSYTRGFENADNGHFNSSDHFAALIPNVPAGAAFEVRVQSTAGLNGEAVMEQASLYVEAIEPTRNVFAATTTDGGQDMTPTTERTVVWEQAVRQDDNYTFTNNSSAIVLDTAGAYMVFINMPYKSIVGQRESAKLRVKLDGSKVPGGEAKQGFIRATGSHNDASVHWSGLVIADNSNQVLSVTAERETTMTNATPIANGRMSVYIEKIGDDSHVFSSRATQVTTNDNNWNQNSPGQHVEWKTDVLVESTVYTHSEVTDPEQIVIKQSGDYLLVYNDSFSTTVERSNPNISVEVNGMPVLGGQTKSHYIRGLSGHNESSGSLVFYLNDLLADSILRVRSVRDFEAGTANVDNDALLLLVQKARNIQALLGAGVTNVTTTTADVTVDFDGSDAVYDLSLFWGLTDGGTNALAWDMEVPMGSFTNQSLTNLTSTLMGLNPDSEFFFSWRATNNAGEIWTDEPRSFFTPILFDISNGGNAIPAVGSATLRAALEASMPADVTIYWGDNDGGTDPGLWDDSINLGVVTNGLYSAMVSNLLFGVEYYYRSFASNSTSNNWADSTVAFTTLDPNIGALQINLCGYVQNQKLTNFPVLVKLGQEPGFTYSDFLSPAGDDLRFWNSNQTVALNYEIELWDTGSVSYVWVDVPEVIPSNTVIWATWGDHSDADKPAYTTDGSTWSNNYVGVWHLGDDAGTGLFPDSVSDNNASDDGASDTTTTTGQIANAQFFDGGADALIVANESNFDLEDAITVSAWFRVEAFTIGWQALVTKGDSAWRLHRQSTSDNLNWVAGFDATAPVNINDGQWHHVVANKSTTTGSRVYIDGVLAASNEFLLPTATNDFQVSIGDNLDSTDREWFGDIDEVRIGHSIQSTEWIAASYLNAASNDLFNCLNPITGGLRGILLSNDPATDITETSAIAHATFEDLGSVADVRFYWNTVNGGTNASLWTNSVFVGSFTNVATTNLSQSLTSLRPNTPYFYTWSASNMATIVWADPTASLTTLALADLDITKTVDIPSLMVGTNLTYSIIVSNAGPSTASGVVVIDTLPPTVTLISSVPTPDSSTNNILTYAVGDLIVGATELIQLDVSVDTDATMTLTNMVQVAASVTVDTNLADNVDMAETVLPDFDSDGMKDFVDPDDDDDGASDIEEQIADTDRVDPFSLLRFNSIVLKGDTNEVTWQGGVMATQYLEQSVNAVTGEQWKTIFTNVPPTPITNTQPDSPSVLTNSTLYYRIRVE